MSQLLWTITKRHNQHYKAITLARFCFSMGHFCNIIKEFNNSYKTSQQHV
jgi:hypothetical protein